MWRIDEEIFDKPSGNVVGVIVGFLSNAKGKERRVLHAYVFTDKAPDVRMYSAGDIGLGVLGDYASLLIAFIDAVRIIDERRSQI